MADIEDYDVDDNNDPDYGAGTDDKCESMNPDDLDDDIPQGKEKLSSIYQDQCLWKEKSYQTCPISI